MPAKLAGKMVEKSSRGIKWTFKKSDGTSPTIQSMTYTLTNLDGDVINELKDVVVLSPTAETTIVLSGDDLQMEDQDNLVETRIMTIKATYDPEDGGADIPIKESVEFPLYNLKAVT